MPTVFTRPCLLTFRQAAGQGVVAVGDLSRKKASASLFLSSTVKHRCGDWDGGLPGLRVFGSAFETC